MICAYPVHDECQLEADALKDRKPVQKMKSRQDNMVSHKSPRFTDSVLNLQGLTYM